MKSIAEYPVELQETVRALRKLQGGIDRHDNEADKLRIERDVLIDELIAGGMGPKEVMEIVGLGRNAYYQRVRRQA